MTEDELRLSIVLILDGLVENYVDYRMANDASRAVDAAATNIVEMLNKKGVLHNVTKDLRQSPATRTGVTTRTAGGFTFDA